jgi:thymidylate synthase (FAD)
MTMQTEVDVDSIYKASDMLLKFLLTADHTSVLEHCSITFLVRGPSRSLLAQLSRHRHASLTCQSQHYQDYREAPFVVHPDMQSSGVEEVLRDSMEAYIGLVDSGVPKEEARQVLPNAAVVNLLWTVNARGLLSFFRQRLCRRNVKEMQVFAEKAHAACMLWWPELFQFIGAPCRLGTCNQGRMKDPQCK